MMTIPATATTSGSPWSRAAQTIYEYGTPTRSELGTIGYKPASGRCSDQANSAIRSRATARRGSPQFPGVSCR